MKTHRLGIRITDEMKEKLSEQAKANESETMSQEARKILARGLGIKPPKNRREVA